MAPPAEILLTAGVRMSPPCPTPTFLGGYVQAMAPVTMGPAAHLPRIKGSAHLRNAPGTHSDEADEVHQGGPIRPRSGPATLSSHGLNPELVSSQLQQPQQRVGHSLWVPLGGRQQRPGLYAEMEEGPSRLSQRGRWGASKRAPTSQGRRADAAHVP